MSTDTKVTVTGWVGTQPRHFVAESGTNFTSFRLASTKRFYNRAEDCWVDGLTTWFTVKAWRTMAINVAESLRKSDPVVVHGTLTSETWDSPDGPRTTFVIEAEAVGPDLARGQATFRHTVHTKTTEPGPEAAAEAAAAAGPPADPWGTAVAPGSEPDGKPDGEPDGNPDGEDGSSEDGDHEDGDDEAGADERVPTDDRIVA